MLRETRCVPLHMGTCGVSRYKMTVLCVVCCGGEWEAQKEEKIEKERKGKQGKEHGAEERIKRRKGKKREG